MVIVSRHLCLLIPILIMMLMTMVNGENCNPDVDKTGEVATKIMTIVTGLVNGTAAAALNVVIAMIDSMEEDKTSQVIQCYLREYHLDRVNTLLTNVKNRYSQNKNNYTKLYRLLEEMEHLDNIGKFQTSDDNTKAAVYPIIPLWAIIHFGVYEQLMKLSTTDASWLKTRSDKWLIFYSKLRLRYARPYRHSRIEELKPWHHKAQGIRESSIWESPVESLEKWEKWAYSPKTMTELENLLNTCKLTSGSTVEFRVLGYYNSRMRYKSEVRGFGKYNWRQLHESPMFFSCWGSGSRCEHRPCAEVFEYDHKKYKFGYKCRGETFWIYSDNKYIHDSNVVNINYSTWGATSYWVSNYRNGRWFDTKTCPGHCSDWKHVKSNCGAENLHLHRRSTAGNSTQLYDGQMVTIGHRSKDYHYELYVKGECSNNDFLHIPQI